MPLTPEEEQLFIERNKKYSVPQNDFLSAVAEMPRDQAVKILRLATATGLDPVEAAKYSPTAVIQDLIGAADFEDVGKFAPKTYSFLNDPLNMAIVRSKENVNTLATIENEWKPVTAFTEGWRDLARNAIGFVKGLVEAARQKDYEYMQSLSEDERQRKLELQKSAQEFLANYDPALAPLMGAIDSSQGVRDKALDQILRSKYLQPREVKADTALGQYGLDFIRMVPQVAAQMAAYLLGGPATSMAFMGTQIAGGEYLKLTDQDKVEPDRALAAAIADAVMQAPLEQISLGKIFKKIPANSTRGMITREVLERSAVEGLTEWVQQYPEAAAEIWAKNPDMTIQEMAKEFVDQFWEITKEGLYQGLVTAPFGAIGGAAHIAVQERITKAYVEQQERIQQAIIKSELLGVSPEVVEKHIESVTNGAVTYIDPEGLMLFQQQRPDLVEALGVTEKEISEALATEQMVEVPTAKYDVVAAQNPELHQALKDDIAPSEDGYTLRRLKEKNVGDVNRTQEEVKRREREVKEVSDAIYQNMLEAGVKPEVAKSALVALVKNAHVMSPDDPAGWLRTKGPIFRKGKAAEASGYFQYAGPQAEIADHLELARAQEMERQGTDPETIRRETGWFRGMDGKWRFEIDDSQAKLINIKQIEASLTSEIEGILSKAKKTKNSSERDRLYSEADSLIAELDKKKQPVLRNVLDHPALYKAYPWIADVKVVFSKLKPGDNGSYDPTINTIEINQSLPPEEIRETLLHEIQHVIQEHEGFARGGNIEGQGVQATEADWQALERDIQNRIDEIVAEKDKWVAEQLEKFIKTGSIDAKKLESSEEYRNEITSHLETRYWDRHHDAREAYSIERRNLDDIKARKPNMQRFIGIRRYNKLAGEIEARDTAARADLTAEQRKEIAPDLRSDAIIVFGGKEFAYNSEKVYNNSQEDYVDGGGVANVLRETAEYEATVVDHITSMRLRDIWGWPLGRGDKRATTFNTGRISRVGEKIRKNYGKSKKGKKGKVSTGYVQLTLDFYNERKERRQKAFSKTVGFSITPELVEHGVISLVGKKAISYRDLAMVAYVLRHPGYEKFHVVYVDKNKNIVHHETLTAGLPSAAYIAEKGKTVQEQLEHIKNNIGAYGADHIYIIHNHPSGHPDPSREDIHVTEYFSRELGQFFNGHIILDHTTYAFIDPNGNVTIDPVRRSLHENTYNKESIPHQALFRRITTAADLAHVAAIANMSPETSVLVHVDTKLFVRAVQLVPNVLLKNSKTALRYMRMQVKKHFGTSVFVITDSDDVFNSCSDLYKDIRDIYDVLHVRRNLNAAQVHKKNISSVEWFGIPAPGGATKVLEPEELFQGEKNAHRGMISWDAEGRAIITLFENHDPSTLIHEMVGHYFMQNLIEMGAKEDAPDWMKRDRRTILDWVGIADWDQASEEQKREAHEKLARAAEAYFMEGKAPSLETRGIFRRFKDWLLAVYKTVKNLGVNITPEIRAVFDRMLATEEEIAQVELLEEYHQRLPQEVWDKLTDAQKDELDRAILRAREQAENVLRARIMRFISADNQYALAEEYAAAQKFISEELAKDPLYMARAAMMAPANKKEIKDAIAARIEEKIEQYIEVLVRNSKLGVEKKTVTQTEEGELVFSAGFSRNQKWYKDMLAELGGKLPKAWSEYIDWVRDGKPVAEGEKPKRMPPKMYEKYREIAEKHLKEGYIDNFFGEIPPDDEYINLKEGTPGWEFVMDNGGGLKLNRALLVEEYPDLADKIPRQMVVNEGGFSADLIAEIFGFSSGDELLRRIISDPPFGEAVKIRLKAHMKQFRDILENPEALRQEAQEAMYSDDGATLIALENQFIQEALGKIQTREEARKAAIQARESAKAVAREKMAAMPLEKAMKLHTYIAAERRAAEKAAKAMAKGDLAKAREYKEVQLVSHAMVMESLRLRREYERITKYLKRQQKADRDTWKKEEHFVQAAEILRRFGYAHKQYDPNIRRETLQAWATRMNDETAAVSIADWLFDETYENMPKRLTIEQLKDVENALRNIKRLAQQEDAFYTLFGKAEISAAISEAEERLADRKDVYIPEFGEEEAERKGNWWRGYLFSIKKFTQIVNELDGNKDFGFFYKLLYEGAYQAANKMSDIVHGLKGEMAKAFGLYTKKELRDMVNKKQYYPELGVSATKMTIIQMALHTGSESNRHVLFSVPPIGLERSSLWVEGKPQETEARVMAFLGRTLDARDWQFVQNIWDIINSLWPMANDMHKEMTGFSMEKVEAQPFTVTLADGSALNLRGGYFPLKEDSRSRLKAAQRGEAGQDPLYTERSFIWNPTTRTGYTHARTGAVYPVSLDTSNIFRHLFDVAHDIAFRPVVTDLRRLVKNPDFEQLMKRKLGPEGYNAILDFVAAAANSKTEAAGLGRGLDWLARAANLLRERVVIAQLMFRVKTLLQNFANPFLYGNAVDGFTHADALLAFIQRGALGYWTPSGYRQMREFVLSKSAFMRDKLETPDFTLHELRDKVTGEQSKVVKFGTMLLAETDNLTNIPMWLEAYHKKINEGASEYEAVRFADTLIDRATGSGRKIDTASLLRSNAVIRILTMFQSFMNTQLNAWIREYKIFVAEKDVPRLLVFVASRWWLFVAASMWLGGDWPDEDKDGDKRLAKWVSEVLGYPLRLMPIVGEVAAIALDQVLGVKTFGYRMSPIQGVIETGQRTVGATIKWIKGEKETKDLLEAASTFGAFLVPYPDQFNDWFWNAYDILNEGMEPQFTDLIKRRPRRER